MGDILFELSNLLKKVIYISHGNHCICDESQLDFETNSILSHDNIKTIVDEVQKRLKKEEYCGIIINITREKSKHCQILDEIEDSKHFLNIKNAILLTCIHDNMFKILKKNLKSEQIKSFTKYLGKDNLCNDDKYISIKLKKQIHEILHVIKVVFRNYCFILVGCNQLGRGVSFCSTKVEDGIPALCVKTIFNLEGAFDGRKQAKGRVFRGMSNDIKPRVYEPKKYNQDFGTT